MQDYIRRDGRFQDGLGVQVVSSVDGISLLVSTIGGKSGWIQRVEFARFTAILREDLQPSVENWLCVDFVARTPREHVAYLNADLSVNALFRTVIAMPKLQELHLVNTVLGIGSFLQPDPHSPSANEKILPSLRHLHLDYVVLCGSGGWSEIISYLTRQTSGGQRISLTISDTSRHICRGMLKRMESLVQELILNLDLDDDCPHDYCQTSDWEGD